MGGIPALTAAPGEATLDRVAADEWPEWQKLWADVATTLARAEKKSRALDRFG
jgi:hypothetical protein